MIHLVLNPKTFWRLVIDFTRLWPNPCFYLCFCFALTFDMLSSLRLCSVIVLRNDFICMLPSIFDSRSKFRPSRYNVYEARNVSWLKAMLASVEPGLTVDHSKAVLLLQFIFVCLFYRHLVVLFFLPITLKIYLSFSIPVSHISK